MKSVFVVLPGQERRTLFVEELPRVGEHLRSPFKSDNGALLRVLRIVHDTWRPFELHVEVETEK